MPDPFVENTEAYKRWKNRLLAYALIGTGSGVIAFGLWPVP